MTDLLSILSERITDLPRQQAFFLVKNCLAVPKLLYLLRTSPTFCLPDLVSNLDEQFRDSREKLFNVPLTVDTKSGGIGIPLPSDLCTAAYISHRSCARPSSTLSGNKHNGELMRKAIEIWTAQVPNDTTPPLESIRQKDWYRPIVQSKLNSLLNTDESIDRARLHGFAYPGDGDWLNVLPSNNLGLALTDHQFSIACPLRLGAPVSSSHKCECGVVTDRYGSHQLVCPKIMSCFARHQLGDDVIYDSAPP